MKFALIAMSALFLAFCTSMGITDNFIVPLLRSFGLTVTSDTVSIIENLVTYLLVIIIYTIYYRYKKYRDEIDAELCEEIKDLERRLHSAELDVKIYKARYEPEATSQQAISFDTSQEKVPDQTIHAPDVPLPHSDSSIHSRKTSKQPFFRSWNPAIFCIIAFFALIAFFYIRTAFLPGTSSAPISKDSPDSISRSVDFETSYVGSVNRDLVHLDTCSYAKNILDENRVYYESIDDALNDGRKMCAVCLYNSPVTSSSSSSSDSSTESFTRQYLELRRQREEEFFRHN